MQIQSANYSQTYCAPNFKSIYPVYFWVKNGDKALPVFEKKAAQRLQRELSGILNNTKKAIKRYPSEKRREFRETICAADSDYKNNKYVRSISTDRGGVKEAWNGNISKIDPSIYILTGRDAVDFTQFYGKPIGYAKSGNMPKEQAEFTPDLESAKKSYYCGSEMYRNYSKHLTKDGYPMCLHVYLEKCTGNKKGYLVNQIEFDKQNNIESKFLDNIS